MLVRAVGSNSPACGALTLFCGALTMFFFGFWSNPTVMIFYFFGCGVIRRWFLLPSPNGYLVQQRVKSISNSIHKCNSSNINFNIDDDKRHIMITKRITENLVRNSLRVRLDMLLK